MDTGEEPYETNTFSSPLASAGFNMLAASNAWPPDPAPTSVCASSMKSIISPSLPFTVSLHQPHSSILLQILLYLMILQ